MESFDRKAFNSKMDSFVEYERKFLRTYYREYKKVSWEAFEYFQGHFPHKGCKLAISNRNTPYTEVIVVDYFSNHNFDTLEEMRCDCFPVINVRPFYKNGNVNERSTPDLRGHLDFKIVKWITDENGKLNKKPIPNLPYLIIPDNYSNLLWSPGDSLQTIQSRNAKN